MPAANLLTNIGSTFAVVVGVPATEDPAGFTALTYVTVGDIIVAPETGDETEDVSETTLAGRTKHANGAKDGGSRNISMLYNKTDAGQVILRANNNGASQISCKLTDANGDVSYFYGVVANLKRPERAASGKIIESGVIRINSATIQVYA